MDTTEFWTERDDGAKIFVRRWMPENAARAIVHIVHGMTEHSLRYHRAAKDLCENGCEVWAADLRGHGKTADPHVNKADSGGLLGHCADKNAFSKILADIDAINKHIAREHPGLPLFLLGHSWGSFLAQGYIEHYDPALAGCILSGARGPGKAEIFFGAPFLQVVALLRGSRKTSKLVARMAMGAYNKPFRPNRSPFDWASRDEKEVDAFASDPLCGNPSSIGFFRDMVLALRQIHNPKEMRKIRQSLPVYVFSGNNDPVGNMGSGPTALVKRFQALGLTDIELVLYPGARHEVLHETNYKEATENLCAWLNTHIGIEKTKR
jgi:alpha-beta hydrolase superfamily lysophospholipase